MRKSAIALLLLGLAFASGCPTLGSRDRLAGRVRSGAGVLSSAQSARR